MNIKRFHAATSREALAKARMAFGEGTLILSNRPTATGVEVVATAEETLHALNQDDMADARPQAAVQAAVPASASRPARAPLEEPAARRAAPAAPPPVNARRSIEADTEQLAMSTLSFQDYVRERMLRRRHEAMHGKSPSSAPEAVEPPMPAPTFVERARSFEQERNRELQQERLQQEHRLASERAQPTRAPAQAAAHDMEAPPYQPAERERARELAPAAVARHNPLRSIPMDLALEPQRPLEPALSTNVQQGVMSELQSMKELIEERFNTLTWLGQARQNPIQTNLMLKLIRRYGKDFRVSYAISGTALDLFEQYVPEVLDSFTALAQTGCVEFVAETAPHSLAFLYSRQEFDRQVQAQAARLKKLFGVKPVTFKHTECVYNNDLAAAVAELGFKAVLAEGTLDQVQADERVIEVYLGR